MLHSQAWELFEFEICAESPEECFHWKFKHVCISQTHCDEVIVLESVYFTPKAKLFAVLFRLKLAQSHLELHSTEYFIILERKM
jgi:hypothetical protein